MVKTMDKNKICFIICANNRQFLDECLLYINNLIIPEGIEVQILINEGASSMCQGYNEAMDSSDAKYKVYLHQDTFILNKKFISDLINIFESDTQIGLVGMIGAPKLSHDAVMWHDKRVGDFYRLEELIANGVNEIERFNDSPREVEAVDGLLIATSVDIKWREDILKGWDFYDVSQCLEFKRKGYKVVVAPQEVSWTNHVCGAPAFWNYEKNRQIILKEYPEVSEDKRLNILFVASDMIAWNGIALGLSIAGHNVGFWKTRPVLGDIDYKVSEELEEFLEENKVDLVVTFDFVNTVSNACNKEKVRYLAWVFDSPLFELYSEEARKEYNHIMVFDKKQYEKLSKYPFAHLHYGTLATDIERYGSLKIADEDKKKYGADVSFVGRLYNIREFDSLFDNGNEKYLAEANQIFDSCFCKWDGKTTIYDKASQEFVDFFMEKYKLKDWEKYELDDRIYVEGFRLARRLNELERVAVLNRVAQKHKVVLFTDDKKIDGLKNVDVRGSVTYDMEMPLVFYFSKINLNISSRSIETGIPQRVLDIMAVGGFVLTNYQEEIEEYFKIGEEIEVFHDLDELERKVDYYLKHEDKRLRIAMNGYKKVSKEFSYTAKASKMVDIIFDR